jgi:CRP-like cAMP-binding protein
MNSSRENDLRVASQGGPVFFAPDLWAVVHDSGSPLGAEDRAMLGMLATIERFRKGDIIYKARTKAEFVFNVISGTVKSCVRQDNGATHLTGFMFPNDLFGLTEGGNYTHTTKAVTAVTVYKIPSSAIDAQLRRNASLNFHVICKLSQELREARRHALLLSRHRAVERICLFLRMLETVQKNHRAPCGEIFLPMSRSDIGAYVGISPEAVSRCLRELAGRRVISFRDRRRVQIADRRLLDAIIDGKGEGRD